MRFKCQFKTIDLTISVIQGDDLHSFVAKE